MKIEIKTCLLAVFTLIMVGCSTTPLNNSYEQKREIKLSGKKYSAKKDLNKSDWHFEVDSIRYLDTGKYVYETGTSTVPFANTTLNVNPTKYIVVVNCFYKSENSTEERFLIKEEHTVNLKWIESVSFQIGSVKNTCTMRPLYNSKVI